jgi:hypothetical protein
MFKVKECQRVPPTTPLTYYLYLFDYMVKYPQRISSLQGDDAFVLKLIDSLLASGLLFC